MQSTFVPPGGPLEVVFSFDTTGSMYGALDQVRGSIQDLIQRLQADIPGIRIAVLAHGDYCDADKYVTKWMDFTDNVAELCDFVKTIERTFGGDAPECYELAMRKVRTELSWSPGSRRAFVLIGDDEPHEPDYPQNTENIDWREETRDLALMGVTIYGVQCLNSPNATAFYKTISTATGGRHLELDSIGSVFEVLMAVCYRESNHTSMLADYEKEVRARCQHMGPDVEAIFASLRTDGTDSSRGDSAVAPASSFSPLKATTGKTGAGPSTPAVPKMKKSSSITRVSKPRRLKKKAVVNKALDKYKVKNLPLLRRENVPDCHFSLRLRKWSPWTVAVVPSLADDADKSLWAARTRRGGGFRRKVLPLSKSNSKGFLLIEVAVKAPRRKRRAVLCCVRSQTAVSAPQWYRSVFKHISRQVDRMLQQDCTVLVRTCALRNEKEVGVVRKELRRYDYAWGGRVSGRGFRDVC